jgi:hypothetical protein
MSTKTTFKRIALVTVAALGFGVLTSVAPANAAYSASTVTAINITKVTVTPVVDAVVEVNFGFTAITETTTAAMNWTGALTTYPTGGSVAVTAQAVRSAPATAGTSATWAGQITAGPGTLTYTGSTVSAASRASINAVTVTSSATAGFASMAFTPTVAGSYVMSIWADMDQNGLYSVGEAVNQITLTVSGVAASATPDFGNTNATTATSGATPAVALAGIAGADNATATAQVSAVGVTQTVASGRVGVRAAFAPNYTIKVNAGGTGIPTGLTGGAANLNWTITNPAGTAVSSYTSVAGTTAMTTAEQYITGEAVGTLGATTATSVASSSTTSIKGTVVYFPTATAGTYTITVWHDGNRNDLVDAYEAVATSTYTVLADALPSITFTKYGSTTPAQAAAGSFGMLVKVSLRNSTTAVALAENETLVLTGDTGTVFDMKSVLTGTSFAMADASNNTTVSLTRANFNALGDAYVNVGNTTAGDYTVTATIQGGTAAGANGSFSQSTINTTTYPKVDSTSSFTNVNTLDGVAGDTIANGDSAKTWTVKPGVATSVGAKVVTAAGAAAGSYSALVTDTLGLITGIAGAKYNINVTKTLAGQVAASSATLSVTIPATVTAAMGAADSTIATMVIDKATDATLTIAADTAAATYIYVNPAQDAATFSIRAAVASSNKFTATVTDQFGNAMPSVVVTGSITGRNSTTVVPGLVTDANGQVSYTLPDTHTGTVALVDTLTFAVSGATSGVVTVNYATYLPVSTITMTTPDSANATATGIAGSIKTDISSADGAEAGAVDVTVVLKDANGATLPAGIPVTFSVAGTGVAILSTHVTGYTDSAGSVTTKVYGWLNGDRVVTATAGTITATGTIYFRQTAAASGVQAEARTIAAKASGNLVTATVTDRFGNPISGISVIATRVGTGTFNGTSSITGTTDAAGVVEFVLTNGTADVTVSFTSSTFGASAATKGYQDAGITALTAYTAGTATLAEEGVGASFDAAGVNSVTVKGVADTATLDTAQAAQDAAAEATDAANAATDAANAAAEAADAATAAAQDAADAVAALSAQVSSLISGLKSQLTALTNLVIKIQKKVKA